jgi:integrase/recombinase XerD
MEGHTQHAPIDSRGTALDPTSGDPLAEGSSDFSPIELAAEASSAKAVSLSGVETFSLSAVRRFPTGAQARAVVPPGELARDPVAPEDVALFRNWFSGKSLPTCRLYRRVVVQLLDAYPGKRLSHFEVAEVNAYLRARKERLSPDSFATEAAILRALFSYAFARGHVPRNLAVELLKGERLDRASCISRKVIPEDQARLLIRAGTTHRDRVLLMTLYITGCRAAELSFSRWLNLTKAPGGGSLLVIGKRGRTRSVRIPPAELQLLLSLKAPGALPSDPIFATERDPKKALSPARIWERVKAAARSCGVTDEVSPHWFRHMNATHAMQKGCSFADIVKQHGHADPRTAGHYLSALEERGTSEFLDTGVAAGLGGAAARELEADSRQTELEDFILGQGDGFQTLLAGEPVRKE